MTSPKFAQIPLLPALDRRADDWTLDESSSFASQLYLGMYFAIAMAMLRDLGHETTYRIYGQMLSAHQKHFFIPGIRKLGLDRLESHAAAAAMYHCISNGIGGLRTGYAIESDKKVWLMYFPYTADNPGAGFLPLATHPELPLDEYRGWHGNNGRYLGNRRLRFVATHHISEGDPFMGGYFEDTGRELADHELVADKRGEQPPPGLKILGTDDALDPKAWPPERRAKALRKYAVTWFADRLQSALGADDKGDAIARRGIQFMLHTWVPRFHAAVGGDGMDPTAELAKYVQLFHSVAGVPAELKPAAGGWELKVEKGLAEFVGDPQSDQDKARFAKVLGDAWRSAGLMMDSTVSVDDSGKHWTIRPR